MTREETSRPDDRAWGRLSLTCTLGGILILLVFLAVRLSFWSDEFEAIRLAQAPWSGANSFWELIRHFIANPPGDLLVLWVYRRVLALTWLRVASPELFWRVPSIAVYVATAMLTYFFVERRSGSGWVATIAAALFLAAPGPFHWATETRFYAWALFFMTLAVWKGLEFIEGGFKLRAFAELSLIASLGVLFHIALALIAYLLWGYGLCRFLECAYRARRARAFPDRREAVLFLLLGFIPYRLYRFLRRHWMFVPGGAVTVHGFMHAVGQTFTDVGAMISSLLPFGSFWESGGWVAWLAAMGMLAGFAAFRKDRVVFAKAFFLLAVVGGGAFGILLSTGSARFIVMPRYFLCLVPALLAAFTSFVPRPFKIPSELRWAIPLVFATVLASAVSRAAGVVADGSPAKVSYDFADFRDAFRLLPDRRSLVVVGLPMDDQFTDHLGYIGIAAQAYLREFSPLYLSEKRQPDWKIPEARAGWLRYDYLVLARADQLPSIPSIPWDDIRCSPLPWGTLQFCRPFPAQGASIPSPRH